MKQTTRLMIVLGLVLMTVTSCKTKQKVAEIPAGAKIVATVPAPVAVTPTPPKAADNTVSAVAEPEITRNENFALAEGETNTDAMKFKYHVVVGSFSVQSNAKGLQSILNGEGNNSVIVVNEKGMFRLLIASFNDYKQAHARIKELTSRFPDAWVLMQK